MVHIFLFSLIGFFYSANGQFQQARIYTIANGLPSNFVNDVIEDKNGFLWLTTNNGIVRYDGKFFKKIVKINLKEGESANFKSSKIYLIGDVLYFTGMEGVRTINVNTHAIIDYKKAYNKGKEIALGEVFVVYMDCKKRLWLTTASQGIFLWSTRTKRFEKYPNPKYLGLKEFNWVSSFCEQKNGDIFFTCLQGLVKLNTEDSLQLFPYAKFYKDYKNCRSTALDIGVENKLLIIQDDIGASLFDIKTGKYTYMKMSSIALNMETELNSFQSHFSSPYGQMVYDKKLNELKLYTYKNAAILKTYTSKDSSLWLATQSGLVQYIKVKPIDFTIKHNLKTQVTFYFSKQQRKYYYTSTYNPSQIYTLSETDNIEKKYGRPFDNAMMRLCKDLLLINDTLYLSSYNGLWKYHESFSKPIAITQPKELINCYGTSDQLVNYNEQLLIAGVENGPVLYNVKTNSYKLLYQDSKSAADKDYGIIPCYTGDFDNNGNIYIAPTFKDSIYIYNIAGNLLGKIKTPFYFENKKYNGQVTELIIDKDDNIWIFAFEKGLYRYDTKNKKWQSFYDQKLFNIVEVAQMSYDGASTIYLLNSNESWTFNVKTLQPNRIDIKYSANYNNSSISDIVPIEPYKFIFHDGSNQAHIYNLLNDTAKTKPYLYIENLKLKGQLASDELLQNEIILPPNENAFSIDYGLAYLNRDDPVQYFIKLEGLDNEWRSMENIQTVNYANIVPGTYTLRLKASSISGMFKPVEKFMKVTLQAAWYQTWWFKLLSILAIAYAVFYVIRLYYKNQLQKERAESEKQLALANERNRIAADMHDDLGAGLSQIRFMARDAIEKTENQELKNILENTKNKSDGLVDKMNDIIWSLNAKDVSMEDLIYYMKANFTELVESVNINFVFLANEMIPNIELKNEVKRNIYLVCKEAIHNAVKHSQANTIEMKIEIENRNLRIVIIDNGIGFDVHKKNMKGNGLNNYYKRLESIGGTVHLDSGSKGTTVKFNISL